MGSPAFSPARADICCRIPLQRSTWDRMSRTSSSAPVRPPRPGERPVELGGGDGDGAERRRQLVRRPGRERHEGGQLGALLGQAPLAGQFLVPLGQGPAHALHDEHDDERGDGHRHEHPVQVHGHHGLVVLHAEGGPLLHREEGAHGQHAEDGLGPGPARGEQHRRERHVHDVEGRERVEVPPGQVEEAGEHRRVEEHDAGQEPVRHHRVAPQPPLEPEVDGDGEPHQGSQRGQRELHEPGRLDADDGRRLPQDGDPVELDEPFQLDAAGLGDEVVRAGGHEPGILADVRRRVERALLSHPPPVSLWYRPPPRRVPILRIVSAAEAVSVIQSGNRVFIHSVAAAPRRLIEAMTARAGDLRVVEIIQLHTEGEAPYAAPGVSRSFRVNSVFVGPNLRDAVQEGRADYLPVFLSEVPKLFRSGLLPLDVALVQVSPPDRHGFCSLGVSVDATPGRGPDRADRHRPGEPPHAPLARRRAHPRRRHRVRRGGRRPAARGPPPAGLRGRPRRSATTAPSSSRTAPRCSSASAPSPTRRWRPWAATTGSASTPRCSPTGSSTSSSAAWSPGR